MEQQFKARTKKNRSSIILLFLLVDAILIISLTGLIVILALANASVSVVGNDKAFVVMVDTLNLSETSVQPGQEIVFTFSVKNAGNQIVKLQELTIGGRLNGKNWDEGVPISYPGFTNITLQPGATYQFKGSRAFYTPGDYYAEPVVRIGGNWGGISPFTRVYFTIN